MTFDIQLCRSMSTQAKVAFAIALARPFLTELDGEARSLAESGLDMASAWRVEGEVTGDGLYSILLNDRDNGLLIYADTRHRRPTDLAISVIGGAISYVSNHAYRSAGEYPPDGIDRADDDFLFGWLVEEAAKSPAFDGRKLADLCHRLSIEDEEDG